MGADESAGAEKNLRTVKSLLVQTAEDGLVMRSDPCDPGGGGTLAL